MAPRPRSDVLERLCGMEPAAFAEFVAALWRAGGWTVERGAADAGLGALLVTDGTERHRYLLHHPDLGWAPTAPPDADGIDGVITPAVVDTTPEGLGLDLLDGAALYDRLYYGIDRERCGELFERYFGTAPTVAPPDPDPEPDRTGATDAGGDREAAGDGSAVGADTALGSVFDDRVRMGSVGAAVIVVSIVVIGGALGAVATPFGGAFDTAGPTPAGSGTPDDARSIPATGTPVSASDGGSVDPATPGNRSRYVEPDGADPPPGVTADGIVDAGQLAQAHGAALRNRSFTVTLTYREFVGGEASARVRETIRVASPSRYASTIETVGSPASSPVMIADTAVYARGTADREGGTEVDRRAPAYPGSTGWVHDRLTTYVEWFLSVESSWIADAFQRGNTTYYWIGIRRDPWPGVQNTRGSALIDEHGIVHEIRRSYRVPDSNVTATATIRLTAVNETTVTAPAWYRGTNTTTTTTATATNGSASGTD